MANRTFGWIQNPSSTDTLQKVVSLFVHGSIYHTYMLNERLPLLRDIGMLKDVKLYDIFVKWLSVDLPIPYDILKGKGCGAGKRADAKCSGLVQAAITGQQRKIYKCNDEYIEIKKPFTDDWTADGFLRWAVSLGFLDYDYEHDTCAITANGKALVNATTEKERKEILGSAFLMYPPVCRIMKLLKDHEHLTKFELGSKLGFTDEAGFTSYPQRIWVQAYEEATDDEERKKLRSDTEGSSDKYARMICSWLVELGWVVRTAKTVAAVCGSKTYQCNISSAFMITASGITNYNRAMGKSKGKRLPKIVYREMLASKASDAAYLRMRRSEILRFLGNHRPHTVQDVLTYLKEQGMNETDSVIIDDISGLANIGLDVEIKGSSIRLLDDIIKLIPYSETVVKENTGAVVVKERVRPRLKHINHKYLTLIDYAFSSKEHCTEFEIYTIDLLSSELAFNGVHLGGSRKPDGVFYLDDHGVIVDNKAYAKGFSITRGMADEMVRYVQENRDRNPERNHNLWWLEFGSGVSHFNFVFISSLFKGNVVDMLNNIRVSTGVDGCALTVENLLYFADALKGGTMTYDEFLSRFDSNSEIVFPQQTAYVVPQREYDFAADFN